MPNSILLIISLIVLLLAVHTESSRRSSLKRIAALCTKQHDNNEYLRANMQMLLTTFGRKHVVFDRNEKPFRLGDMVEFTDRENLTERGIIVLNRLPGSNPPMVDADMMLALYVPEKGGDQDIPLDRALKLYKDLHLVERGDVLEPSREESEEFDEVRLLAYQVENPIRRTAGHMRGGATFATAAFCACLNRDLSNSITSTFTKWLCVNLLQSLYFHGNDINFDNLKDYAPKQTSDNA